MIIIYQISVPILCLICASFVPYLCPFCALSVLILCSTITSYVYYYVLLLLPFGKSRGPVFYTLRHDAITSTFIITTTTITSTTTTTTTTIVISIICSCRKSMFAMLPCCCEVVASIKYVFVEYLFYYKCWCAGLRPPTICTKSSLAYNA
jgi:hypothetical protein